jgi:fructose-bisphosphate aldolase, class II
MNLMPMYSILKKTYDNSYAQPAFNITCYNQLKSALSMHESLRSPAIIQVGMIAMGFLGDAKDMYHSTFKEKKSGAENAIRMLRDFENEISIPVAIHADHVKEIDICKMLVDVGFTSVMIDGSHLPYDDNVEITREVVRYAHSEGVTVEAELGVLAGNEDDIFSEKSTYTNPMVVPDFVQKTGVDCLAISFGTKHGANKGLSIKLRDQIVTASKENLLHCGLDTILVSHGSSTVPQYIVKEINLNGGVLEGVGGIPIDELKKVINSGIGKINIDTDMRLSITRNVRELLLKHDNLSSEKTIKEICNSLEINPGEIDFRLYLKSLRTALIYGSKSDRGASLIMNSIEKGVQEIVSQLVVHFGSLGKSTLIKFESLEMMREVYRTRIKRQVIKAG